MALLLMDKGTKNMHNDFPPPVGMRTNASLPWATASSASSCPGRKLLKSKWICKASASFPLATQLLDITPSTHWLLQSNLAREKFHRQKLESYMACTCMYARVQRWLTPLQPAPNSFITGYISFTIYIGYLV